MKIRHFMFALGAAALLSIGCTPEEEEQGTKAQLPTVTTIEASSVLSSAIVTGGNITADGGAEVTERGVCYSETPGAVVEGSKVAAATAGKGAFEVTLEGLEFGTTYYYRAYAINEAGVAYGEEMSATTVQPVLATVTTAEVTNAAGESAVCGGNITNDGNSPISARGVVWAETENPTVEGSKTTDGTGKGEFTSTMTGLTVGKTYYVRAYATNDAGTAYGEQKTFATVEPKLPVVVTNDIVDYTTTGAMCGGNVTDAGGVEVTAKGVCWSTTPEPTVGDAKTEDGTGAGEFESELTGCEQHKVYYVRAYATNSVGTSYGEQKTFVPFYVNNGEDMALVAGGTFTVGGGAAGNLDYDGSAGFQCTVPDFYIARTEVTQGLWNEIMGADFLSVPDGNRVDGYCWYPVGKDDYNPQPCITWYDALNFCNKLSVARGYEPVYSFNGETDATKWDLNKFAESYALVCDWSKNGYRLPALPEWEWAAGGGQLPLTKYSGTDDPAELGKYAQIQGHLNGGASEGLFTVATKWPNRLGLYDMTGNATEWVFELAFDYPGDARSYYDNTITYRYGDWQAIKRGGSIWSWGDNGAAWFTTSNWYQVAAGEYQWHNGLRLARTKTN